LAKKKEKKMRYEDYDYDDRDDLSGHHAAGAAEARAEEQLGEDEELFCEYCDRPVETKKELTKSGYNGMVCVSCWEERPWKY
jgi:hypothetical protein